MVFNIYIQYIKYQCEKFKNKNFISRTLNKYNLLGYPNGPNVDTSRNIKIITFNTFLNLYKFIIVAYAESNSSTICERAFSLMQLSTLIDDVRAVLKFGVIVCRKRFD